MSELACESIEKLEKSNIYCAYCDQHYDIFKVIHRCHPLVKCDTKKVTYVEKYHDNSKKDEKKVYDSNEAVATCEKCEMRKKKSSAARRGICPGCEYTGYFKPDEGGLCPGCVAASVVSKHVPVVKEVKTLTPSTQLTSSTLSTQLQSLKLYLDTDAGNLCPSETHLHWIKVRGCTEASLQTPQWFIEDISIDFLNGNYENIVKLSDWLRELSKKYSSIYWSETSSLKWEWLKYLYQRLDDTRYPLY